MGLHNRPDVVVVDKRNRECQIIDVACPGDSRILLKEEKNQHVSRPCSGEEGLKENEKSDCHSGCNRSVG